MIDPRLPTFPPCLECGLLAVLGKGVEARLIDLIDFPIGKGDRDGAGILEIDGLSRNRRALNAPRPVSSSTAGSANPLMEIACHQIGIR